MSLFECVPNVSEGRDLAWFTAVVQALRDIQGLAVLDATSDPSHHRSVVTLAGAAEALHAGVRLLVERSLAHIDLRRHHGEHPRLGAVDVVPFVPLAGTTMDEAVALARRVGRDIGQRFQLPVYLYEEAAIDPQRRRLELIRRGQFEALAARMGTPGWTPDYGPPAPHPSAGACVVGARQFLIAFNVNLATDRLAVARRIAVAIRESSGGLPAVKAMGVMLHHRGLAQVSMNLTDFARTAVHTVFDRVVSEAAADGVAVLDSELIGLIPAAALAGTSAAHLRLTGFSNDQVLETRLRAHGLLP